MILFLNLNAKVIKNEIDSISGQFLNSIFEKAKDSYWHNLEYDNLIITVAMEFLNTPYMGNTLEGEYETCRINLNGLDCVTFVENVLNLAVVIKQEKYSVDNLFDAITKTRYRNGLIIDYTSRLHYTSDWIYQNTQNQTFVDITKSIGGEEINFSVNFMSSNPKFYKSLIDQPKLIDEIIEQEKSINSRTYYYVPKNKVKSIENKLRNGDIICIVTNKTGLDYAHLGFAYKHNDGTIRLLHASTTSKKVIIDTTISEYLNSIKTHKGITVLRPQIPQNND